MENTFLARLNDAARSLFGSDAPDAWELGLAVAVKYPAEFRSATGEWWTGWRRRPAVSLPGSFVRSAVSSDDTRESVIQVIASAFVLTVRTSYGQDPYAADGTADASEGATASSHVLDEEKARRTDAVLATVRAILEGDEESGPASFGAEYYGFELPDDEGHTAKEAGPFALPNAGELRDRLAAHVVGQDPALDVVVDQLLLGCSGLRLKPERPQAVLLFVGPSGVGKTQMAKGIADVATAEGQQGLIRLDMSEYEHPSSITRLTGPPPGYKGSTEPQGWLTQKIIDRPRSVLLLDEIEKADPTVLAVFLQVFDEGRLTDGMGRTVDFSQTVICLTSNLGTRKAFTPVTGFTVGDRMEARVAQRESDITSAVRAFLAPELIGRIDAVVPFAALELPVIEEIAQRMVGDLVGRLADQGRTVRIADEVPAVLAHHALGSEYGVRSLQGVVERTLLMPILRRTEKDLVVAPDGDGLAVHVAEQVSERARGQEGRGARSDASLAHSREGR